MTIKMFVDTRERDLIEKLDTNSDNIVVKQLDLGDIVFQEEDETVLIIERKTVTDLKASICDGRGREQKTRLLGSTPKERIMYLIEGSLNKSLDSKISGLPVSTLIGSMVNTQLRDGIHVYKTSTLDETVNFITKVHDKLCKDGDKYFKENNSSISASKYSSSLKKKKKSNMTPEVWFISHLSLIPQVTEKVAEVIVNEYKSVSSIISVYESTPEHLKEKLISDLKFKLNNGKERRIGDKISARVYKFLYNIQDDDTN